MEKIFKFLTTHNLSATFFVVGWIAKIFPEVVKKIDKLGFEIGSHTHMHQLMY
jgi:peptidoglycan/xylan/chitin deacetylase (PgdA/CDA1 family)